MNRALLSTGCICVALSYVACTSSDGGDDDSHAGEGGSAGNAAGGTAGVGTGGTAGVGTGGSAAASGGSSGATPGGSGGSAGVGTGGAQGGSAGSSAVGGTAGSDGGAGAVAGTGAMAGTGATAGSGGGSGGSAGSAPYVEPDLVTSAQGAFWTTGTFMEVQGATADVTVNDATTFQTYGGFGGTFNEVGWDVLSLLSAEERNRAMNLLFGVDGAHFVFGRIPIGASDYGLTRYTLNETADDFAMEQFSIEHDQQTLIPYIQAALAINPDIRLWASPWTPPTWMKSNGAFDGGNMRDDDMVLAAHALYLAKFVEEYGKIGITIQSIHPQNEPGYETRYPSCLWTAELMTRYIRDFLGPTFQERSVTAAIFLGTMSNADAGKDGTIISTVLADAAATAFVKGFGLQWNMINNVASLAPRGLPIVQSEHKCGNYPWESTTFNPNTAPNDYAYGVESWGLIRDWLVAGVTSYSAWNMVLDKDGKNSDTQRPWPQNALLVVDKTAKTLTLTPAYYVFRHVSQFVDTGATRIGTMGGDALAFKNPDGSLVAVLYNSGADRQTTVAIGGKQVQFDMPGNGFATVNLK